MESQRLIGTCAAAPNENLTVDATAADTQDEIRELREDDAVTRRAIKLLGCKRKDSYEAALSSEDARTWWAHELARSSDELGRGEGPVTANIEGLHRFLEGKVQRGYDTADHPPIREQAFGEALDPDKLERLGRYEVDPDNYELTAYSAWRSWRRPFG
jgi:hypothetical protein